MNISRLFVYWFLLAGVALAGLIWHSRILTRLCMDAGAYIWSDFYDGLHLYAKCSMTGMTQAEFKQRYGHEMAAIIDVSDGFNIEWFSPKIVKFIGFTSDELNSFEDVARLIHPDDLKQFTANKQRRLKGSRIGNAKYRIITKSGGLRWISLYSWLSNGYIFSVARNITAQEKIRQYPN